MYFKESYFKNLYSRVYGEREYVKKESPSEYTNFDIFLSYNIKDIEVVKGIFYLLESKGYKVYLDLIIDPKLKRDECDKETARLIRERLRHSRSLIYASSQNALDSRWMNWELGEVDGKGRKCFIMPVTKNGSNQEFQQKEYLKLYPLISTNLNGEWFISDYPISFTRKFSL